MPRCVLPEAESQVSETQVAVSTQRQHSTTEYLPGMLHSSCPPGLLPKFPSWALCCLDSSAFYNHQHGTSRCWARGSITIVTIVIGSLVIAPLSHQQASS